MGHGLWTCRSCELDGRFVELASYLHDGGYNIMMLDLREHGESQGEQFTFGRSERWGVLARMCPGRGPVPGQCAAGRSRPR